MQGIMLYFSGSGVQIFSLAMIFSLLTGPIGAVMGILKSESEVKGRGRDRRPVASEGMDGKE